MSRANKIVALGVLFFFVGGLITYFLISRFPWTKEWMENITWMAFGAMLALKWAMYVTTKRTDP